MDAFGGDSPLSEAPSSTKLEQSASPLQAKPEVEPEITKPKTKTKAKAKAATKSASASASASRRSSSRVEDRSASPEKPATTTSGIRIKFTRPPSPEKVAIPSIEEEIPAKAEAVEQKDGKRGKKRKSEGGGGVEGEVREVMAKGGKKAKISHEAEAEDVTVAEAEPKKKGVAVKRIGNGGKSSTDLMKDLFDDASEGEEGGVEEVAEPVTKPVIKIKKTPKTELVEEERGAGIIAEKPAKSAKATGSKPRRSRPDDSDVNEINDEIVAEKPSKSMKGSSKSSRTKQESTDNAPATDDILPRTKSKKRKADTTDPKIPVEGDMEVDQALPEEIPVDKEDGDYKESTESKTKAKMKGNKVKTSSQEAAKEKEKEPQPKTSTKNRTLPGGLDQKADEKDIEIKDPLKSSTTTASEINPPTDASTGLKPKKSFAQAVAGSPLPEFSTHVKKEKEKKPMPSIMKFNQTNLNTGSNVGTPDKRSTSTGTGTGTNTPTTSSLKKPPPAVKKAAPSLLESTMASLLGGHTAPKATPKKEVRSYLPLSHFIPGMALTSRKRIRRQLLNPLLYRLRKTVRRDLGGINGR